MRARVRMDGAAAWGWHGCLRLFSFLYVAVFNVFLSERLCPTLLFTFPRTPHSQAVFVVARDQSRALSLVLATLHRLLARRLCWYCLPYAKFQVCFDPVRSFRCTRAVYSSSSLHSDVRSLAHSASTVSYMACISSSSLSHRRRFCHRASLVTFKRFEGDTVWCPIETAAYDLEWPVGDLATHLFGSDGMSNG